MFYLNIKFADHPLVQNEIFLNSYQQKRAFSELKNFEEKTERKHLGRKQVGNIIFVIFLILLFLMFLW